MATEEIQDLSDELEQLTTEIRRGIDGLVKLKGVERSNKVSLLNNRIARGRQVFKSFKIELRDIPKTAQEPFMRKAKEYGDIINKLIEDLNWAESREDLLEGGKKPGDLENMATDEILKGAADIQASSLQSLDRTIAVIEDTRGVGSAASNALVENTEHMERIKGQLDDLESNLTLAGKQLRSFARRAGTDKIIMGFMCLIVCGIVFIIVWSAVKPGSSNNVPDDLKPN